VSLHLGKSCHCPCG